MLKVYTKSRFVYPFLTQIEHTIYRIWLKFEVEDNQSQLSLPIGMAYQGQSGATKAIAVTQKMCRIE